MEPFELWKLGSDTAGSPFSLRIAVNTIQQDDPVSTSFLWKLHIASREHVFYTTHYFFEIEKLRDDLHALRENMCGEMEWRTTDDLMLKISINPRGHVNLSGRISFGEGDVGSAIDFWGLATDQSYLKFLIDNLTHLLEQMKDLPSV